ncbi:MAG: glycosyltransferase family 2 protein [Candidatus Omnitrophica bacterium]|nr:glycosyltransferase family 2 protein [Candidatus Omnitrophota bacterium]MDD5352440.1 glycosyltransferase family 2 protein [Candidatus Omnitrophota bacterium]MDD5550038.1 glycosyltransferase family 2 protein [Candidatus Omnitrophota bacterium]
MDKINLSVVILTKNESKNIKDCIGSVRALANEIIVVDDFSQDDTVKTAELYGARVLIRRMDNEGKHRNWAYAQAENDWVLSLDADERATPELSDEIRNITFDNCGFSAFTIPRRNHIGNYWLKHGGQYPAAQLKLFRKDKFKYEEVQVHPRAFLEGKCGHLDKDIIHYSYRDFADFLNKLNRQTTLEAQKWISTGRKMSFGRALWRTVDRFFRKFIGKKGYLDGFMGFMLAVFDSIYQIISYAKYWEMKRNVQK